MHESAAKVFLNQRDARIRYTQKKTPNGKGNINETETNFNLRSEGH